MKLRLLTDEISGRYFWSKRNLFFFLLFIILPSFDFCGSGSRLTNGGIFILFKKKNINHFFLFNKLN